MSSLLSKQGCHVFTALSLCIITHYVSAQQESVNEQSANEALPEEIIISEKLNITALRAQVLQAEVDMYDVFNEINNDKSFEVSCRDEAPLGTRVQMQQICHPGYYYDALGEEGAAMAREIRGESGFRGESGLAVIAQYDALFQEKMKQAIRENPELLKAIVNFYELKLKLEAERGSSFAN